MIATSTTVVRSAVRHVRTAETMHALGRWAGVPVAVVDAAVSQLRAGNAAALLVSGAQASGKDTVCPAVLEACGITDAVQCRIANAIRGEMAEIIEVIAASDTPSAAASQIAGQFDVSEDTGRLYCDLFFTETRVVPHDLDVFARSERMRRALQWHGDEGRRHQPGYWVKAAYRVIIPTLADGVSVYLTDGRFPGEVDAGRVFGAYTTRLWVPEAARIERIKERDGFVPSLETLRHPGEVGLDDYWGFDLIVDNTGALEPTVAVIAARFEQHLADLRAL